MKYWDDARFRRERRFILLAVIMTAGVLAGIGYFGYEQLEIQKAEMARLNALEALPANFTLHEGKTLSAEELRQLATTAYQEKHFEQAVGYFSQALEQVPDAKTYYGRSEALRARGRMPEALADLQQAVELDPEHPLYSNKLGIVQLSTGSAAEPRMEFRSAQDGKIVQPPKGRIFVAIFSSLREGRFNDSAIHLESAANLLPPTLFTMLLNDPEFIPYLTRPEVSRYTHSHKPDHLPISPKNLHQSHNIIPPIP